jgi:sporulation protein YlmC with PRC-barrel domain
MWNKFAVLTLVAAPFIALPAIAQQAPSNMPAAAQDQEQPTNRDAADAVSGLEVYSSDGQMVGRVAAAITDPNSIVEEIHVQVGSNLGIGERRVAIESDKFRIEGKRVDLSLTADQVKNLPATAN